MSCRNNTDSDSDDSIIKIRKNKKCSICFKKIKKNNYCQCNTPQNNNIINIINKNYPNTEKEKDKGNKGDKGDKGDKGEKGDKGLTGSMGIQGIGFNWRGQWIANTKYKKYDVVYHDGCSYIAINDTDRCTTSCDWSIMVKCCCKK